MSKRSAPRRPDANQAAIVHAVRVLGGVADIVAEVSGLGYDLVVTFPNGTHIVEVKNPEMNWKLRPSEEVAKQRIEAVGGRYWIIETVEQVADLKGWQSA